MVDSSSSPRRPILAAATVLTLCALAVSVSSDFGGEPSAEPRASAGDSDVFVERDSHRTASASSVGDASPRERGDRQATSVDAAVAGFRQAYATDQVIVAPAKGTTLAQVAQKMGVDVKQEPGRSGYGALSVPDGQPVGAFLYQLRTSGLIESAAPNGIVRAAGGAPPDSATASQAVADADATVQSLQALVSQRTAELAAAEQAWADAQAAELAAAEELDAAKDADCDDATEDALEDALDQRKDETDDAKAVRDLAVRALSDATSDLEVAQDDLLDAQATLAESIAWEEQAAIDAENGRLRKIRKAQWFLKLSNHRKWRLDKQEDLDAFQEPDLSDWTVAVLDSGVAYEDHSDASGTYVAAASLADSAIVAPWDFVNDDGHANDDHQHGTHIASIIASHGDIQGLAPTVSLMPLKVLDQNNAGTELHLVEAIWHAIDHGADVVNMSLSFSPAYMPSEPLQQAIDAAAEAGIVLVAAAGNDGSGLVTWPAASPRVVAVASGSPKDGSTKLLPSQYSNLANGVAVTAAGGTIDADNNEDGVSDGILGETIAKNDPTTTGWWFYAGTSQAAAVVSAAAVQLLDAGATGVQAANALQVGANAGNVEGDAFIDGIGAGALDLDASIKEVEDHPEDLAARGTYHVAMMPYLHWKRVVEYDDKGKWKCKETDKWKVKDGDKIEPRVVFTVVNDAGEPVPDVEVMGLMWGTKEGTFKCKTDDQGVCTVKGSSVDPDNYQHAETEMEIAQAWQVETIVDNGVGQAAGTLLFATDGFDLLVSATRNNEQLRDGLLGFHADQSCARESIGEVAEAYSVVNAGTGLATSPMGIVFTPPMIENNAVVTPVTVNLDGTGLATSPMGFTTFRSVDFNLDGTGLATSPMGFTRLQLVAFDGTGLATSPMGFHMLQVFSRMDGTGLATSPMGFSGNPILLRSGRAVGADLSGSSLGEKMAESGWTTEGGHLGASVLAGTGLVGIHPTNGVLGSGVTDGLGTESIDPSDIEAAIE